MVQLELLTDIDMHLFMEKGLRDRVCMASKRFAKGNNPQCSDYDSSKPAGSCISMRIISKVGL